jgi:hypothetical protein
MKSKIYTFLIVLLVIHIAPVIQSCCFPIGCCPEANQISLKTDSVEIFAFQRTGNFFDIEERTDIDRDLIGIFIQQVPQESEDGLVFHRPFSLLSSCFATQDCDSFFFELEDYITKVEVFNVLKSIDFEEGQDITDQFLVESNYSGQLYDSLETVYSRELHGFDLVATFQPKSDSLILLVNAFLSNEEMYSDTLSIRLL